MKLPFIFVTIFVLAGCAALAAGGGYEGALVDCNRTAKTLKESIDCENVVRARNGRPLRPYPASIADGGAL